MHHVHESSTLNIFSLPTHLQGREVADNLQRALTSLEQATELGDRLVVSPTPAQRSRSSTHASTSMNNSTGLGTTGVVEATGEAMLRLAKLCEVLSTGDAALDAGAGGWSRGREELAALAVKEYLRAMAVG